MTKKQWLLLLVALVLLGITVYRFLHWFAPEEIQITHMVRPYSHAKRFQGNTPVLNPAVNTVAFGLNRKCRLTEIKVVNASEVATNKFAHPLWHLVSKSAAGFPTKGFFYGSYVMGMRSKVPNARPDPLDPNVTYRLIVQAGKDKAEHDFKTTAARR